MRRKLVLILAITLSLAASAARAQDPIQSLGRYWGFGWGDGYHSKCTWPLVTAPSFHSASAIRQAPAAPPSKPSPMLEPDSPSDRPATQTSMRRYPRKNR